MPKKKRPLIGSFFGEDGGKNPWKTTSSAKDFLGVLDRKPTKFFRRKKK